MNLPYFEQWLIDCGKKESTAKSYVKNVGRCLSKDDPEAYIEGIKSKSHRSFVRCSWKAYQEHQKTLKSDMPVALQIEFFEIMQKLDAKKVLAARTSGKVKGGFSALHEGSIYKTSEGDLILSIREEQVLSYFSKGDKLVDLS